MLLCLSCVYAVAPRILAEEVWGGHTRHFSTTQVLCHFADPLLICEGIKHLTHLTQASLHLHC